MTSVHQLETERARRDRQEWLCQDPLTDTWLAERFAEAHADRLRFHHRRGQWLIYNRPTWRPDRNGAIFRIAIEYVKRLQQEAVQLPDRTRKEQLTKFAIRAESKPELDRMIGLAKNLHPLADAGEDWDADPWLLGAPNGVVDLRTGELREGEASDRITMKIAAPYDAAADAPRFSRFLDEVFGGDEELIAFVRRFVGYTLTGCTHEQVLALCYGPGANGKSTLINVLQAVLGDYSHNLPFGSLELRQRASIPNDLAALEGKRFVTASETNDGTHLNEARIKMLTGCDRVSARFMHSEWFTFSPVAKFVLAVNHKPAVQDATIGFWRRICLVPFLQSFQGAAREEGLEARLREEATGIFQWALSGCLEWRAAGLSAPAAVAAATQEYQSDSDPIAEFVDECCETARDATTRAAELHETYAKWCEKRRLSKFERLSSKDFGRRMAERFARRKTMTGAVYDGLRVATNRLFG